MKCWRQQSSAGFPFVTSAKVETKQVTDRRSLQNNDSICTLRLPFSRRELYLLKLKMILIKKLNFCGQVCSMVLYYMLYIYFYGI